MVQIPPDRRPSRRLTHAYQGSRLPQLRSFCYAAQEGSVSKAAGRMFLSQPSVSLQIQALEREFKTLLFERRGPKIALTPEGKTLYELAWPLVEAIDTLEGKFAARRGGVEAGRLDIAAGESTLLYLLPPFVKEFADRYPGIELKLHNVTGRDGVAMLRADQVDFAVGPMTEEGEGLDYRDMFAADPMLITALDHPLAKKKKVTIRDIAAYPLILPPRHLATWRVVDFAFHKHKLKYHVKLEAGGWEVIKRYVELGLGISIVASICLTGKERIAAIPVNRYFPRRRYGVVTRRGRPLSPQAHKFLEIMANSPKRATSP
ncbi:MAG: LysR family transcriptional regulator [Planctomycetia bacterium]|nr:LysR family transcriptional regulator [Planctomycetia bacterium]